MEQHRDPAIEDVLGAAPDEASLRVQVTDLLLAGLRGVRAGRPILEQSEVLQEIEAALEAYGNHFYPPERR